jgi:hypothetical protein
LVIRIKKKRENKGATERNRKKEWVITKGKMES